MSLFEHLRDDAIAWCRGRSWPFRALLLLWFAYILVRHLADPGYQSLFKPINLGIHEIGHVLFRAFGEFMSIAGGSLLQLIAPIAAGAVLFRQRDYFGIAVAAAWLGTSLFDVAAYAADARVLALQLVSPFGGGHVVHDWAWMLERLGMLTWDFTIAFVLRAAATVSMAASLGLGGWLIRQMARYSEPPPVFPRGAP